MTYYSERMQMSSWTFSWPSWLSTTSLSSLILLDLSSCPWTSSHHAHESFHPLSPPLLQRVRWPCSPPHLLLHPCPRSGIGEFPGTPDKEVQVFDAIEIELWVHQSCIIITDRSFAYQGTLSEGKPTPSQPLSLFHDSQDSLLLVQISLVGPSSYTL